MKKKMLLGLSVAATGMFLTGCSDSFNPSSSQSGRIYASVDLDKEVITSAGRSKAPSRQAMAVTASQLAIDLNSDDGNVSRHWDSLDNFPTDENFPVGSYTMEASYGNEGEQGFEKPYYHGAATLTVRDSETTPVSITARLANAMVTVDFTDNFKKFFQEYTPKLVTSGDEAVAYDREGEPCYVNTGAVTLQLDVTKFTGSKATLTPKTFNAEPCHHYRLTVDVNAQAGEGQLVLKYDEMLATEDIIIDLSEALINAPAPTLTAKGFSMDEPVEFISGNVPTDELKLTLIAHGGISSLAMTTTSASLSEQGWPAEADLAAGDAALAARLKALGLSSVGLSRNPEKMAVVDLTEVPSHIDYIDGGDNTSTMTFVARDNYGKQSEPVTISFIVKKLEMSLSDPETIYEGDTEVTCKLDFNGNDPAKVKIQTRNERGTWSDVEATITAASRANTTYTVVATGLSSTGDIHLRAVYGKETSAALIIPHQIPPYALTHRDIDVFATTAKVSLIDNPAYVPASRRSRSAVDVAPTADLYMSADGGTTYNKVSGATLSGTTWNVTGLTPGKTYHFRAKADGKPTTTTALATENSTQLPNGNMDEWFKVDGKSNYWWVEYPGSSADTPWGTMNLLTTSQGGSSGAPGASYSAFSGTRSTTDANSGSYAAIISTVGWGSGNTAWRGQIATNSGLIPNGGKCEHITVGELYLGSYDSSSQSAVYSGYEFASRPASMSFYYKYVKRNSADYGYAEVQVLDANGAVLASGNLNLDGADQYTLKTINLSYQEGMNKASKIKVLFKSSGNPACQTISNDNLSSPPSANLTNGRYTGSELYVDDITLNY